MYSLLPHTADVRLHVHAETLESLFRDAMHGMYAVMRGEAAESASPVTATVVVDESADTTALLVDFLNEVLHRAHVGRELFTDVSFALFTDDSLTARLTGIAPASFEEDVKAVTYHEADVRREGEGWATTLVFDI